jgi:hypothetical protein
MNTQVVRRIVYLGFSLLLPIILLGVLSQVDVYASNYVVNTTIDGGPGSLRQAVLDANQNPGPDIITFDLAPQSIITLTYGTLADFIIISDTLTIDGGTAVSLTISGNNERNIFTIAPGTTVTLTELTLKNGRFDNGAVHNDGGVLTLLGTSFLQNGDAGSLRGGAVFNESGTLIVKESRFVENGSLHGAAILNGGWLEINASQFNLNEGRYGAGLLNCIGATAIITSSSFLTNSVEYVGSAVYNLNSDWVDNCNVGEFPSRVIISDSLFSSNFANGAGTLLNEGEMKITSSVIQNNNAELDGGGLTNEGNLSIVSSTIVSNTAKTFNGGAIHQFSGTITISKSLIENNISVGRGGGVAIIGGEALIENSEIISNAADLGGGIINFSTLVISNTQVLSNSARDGGGLSNINGGYASISSTVFSFNHAESGGGIANSGIFTVTNSTFLENIAEGSEYSDGGAILSIGAFLSSISNSVFERNHADQMGGAIYNRASRLFIESSQFDENSADIGGGLYNDDWIMGLQNSTVINGTANQGGGIHNEGELFIENSTISANQALNNGGGIVQDDISASLHITQSTIANNFAPNQVGRDGIWQMNGSVHIQQSIVASNGTENCALEAGNWDGSAYNLADDASCVGFTLTDPMLAPLGDNGGDTLTHALLEGSPAIDAGDNSLCSAQDQRGETRPLDGDGDGMAVCDIGSIEMHFTSWQVYLPLILK